MKVSMDGLRRKAIAAYNKIVREIRDNIKTDEGAIEQYRIEEALDDLRNVLVTLACCSQEGEDGFKELDGFNIESLNEEDEPTN